METTTRVDRLEANMAGLAAAQTRTEVALAQLAEAQAHTEAALTRTDERLSQLAASQGDFAILEWPRLLLGNGPPSGEH